VRVRMFTDVAARPTSPTLEDVAARARRFRRGRWPGPLHSNLAVVSFRGARLSIPRHGTVALAQGVWTGRDRSGGETSVAGFDGNPIGGFGDPGAGDGQGTASASRMRLVSWYVRFNPMGWDAAAAGPGRLTSALDSDCCVRGGGPSDQHGVSLCTNKRVATLADAARARFAGGSIHRG
jgi:hypothetical protein